MTADAPATFDVFAAPSVGVWLRDAMPTAAERKKAGTEERRAAAARLLLELERRQVTEGAARDPRVTDFLAREMERIRLHSDPVSEMARFLGQRRARGRPVSDDEHTFDFAIEVYSLVQQRVPLARAVEQVRQRPGFIMISAEYGPKLYQRYKRKNLTKLRAAFAMRCTESAA